ncbi:MAG: hypothetical protein AB7F22_32955 [Reyranella sp.]|uniref:hypothetical protein n=1 Tax=Reyranella sp. TaxID=1929291 RepID=UPI003D09F0DB
MADKQPADKVPIHERFTWVMDQNVPANQRMVHHMRDDNRTDWAAKIEWITPDALPIGTPLHFTLFLKPGIHGVVRYTTPLGTQRVLVVHVERITTKMQ